YNQVRKVAGRLAKLRGSLQAANNHFNDTATALTGRQGLGGKIERFKDMSSKVTQAIPEIEPLHSDLQSENLVLLAEPLAPEIEPQAAEALVVDSELDEVEEEAPVT
ncbi:MAG: DNA recombination protein RmuC, partial [Gammaproteobacteria bacterium]|nr:DNA recombination protein RmuC [Gammaproteobacteria bacterium]